MTGRLCEHHEPHTTARPGQALTRIVGTSAPNQRHKVTLCTVRRAQDPQEPLDVVTHLAFAVVPELQRAARQKGRVSARGQGREDARAERGAPGTCGSAAFFLEATEC